MSSSPLKRLAAFRPSESSQTTAGTGGGVIYDGPAFLRANDDDLAALDIYIDGRSKHIEHGDVEDLDGCPYSQDHTDGAFRFQQPSGYVDVRCHHNRCAGKRLKDYSDLFPRSHKVKADSEAKARHTATLTADGKSYEAGSGETSTGTASTGREEPGGRVPMLVTLSDVEAQPIEWLWRNWLPRRMLAILGGYGGDGKSTLLAYLMARLSRGGTLPDGTRAPLTNCLILAAEDDPQYAIRPRLDLHSADVSRIHLLKGTRRDNGTQEWLDLKRDADIMRGIIRAYDIGLVVIDPLSSYMPKADRNSEGDVRDALMPLQQLMEETGVAIIGVMHVGKTDAPRRATQRLLGSTAFTALARTVWMIHDLPGEHQPVTGPDDATEPRKVLGVSKANYSQKPPALAFSRPLDGPLRWHGLSPITIEEAFAGGEKVSTREDAEDWLRDFLKGGMQPSDELEAAALKRFSKSTYKRARASLKVQAIRVRDRWYTRLPASEGQESQPSPTAEVGPLPPADDAQESQGDMLSPFPKSWEEFQAANSEPLDSGNATTRQESQIPLIDNVSPLPLDALSPTGTDGAGWEDERRRIYGALARGEVDG